MVAIRKGQYLAAKLKNEFSNIKNETIEIESSEALSLGLTQNENIEPIPQEPINIYDYLVFEAVDNCYFSFGSAMYWAGTVEYSIDEGYHWNKLESNSITPLILSGNKILFKGNIIISYLSGLPGFRSNGKYKISGNLDSIIYNQKWDDSYSGFRLFDDKNCISIKNFTTNSITKLSLNSSYLTELIIPNSITSLHLTNCTELTELTIPNSVTELYLTDCTGLTELTIPNSVTNLSINYLSLNYSNLTELTIPNSVTNLNLSGCAGLTELIIPNSVTNLSLNCSNLTELTIPNSVINLNLSGCAGLTELTIPNSVTSLSDENHNYIFNGCINLTSITISESITSIYYDTFSNCGVSEIIILSQNFNIINDGVINSLSFIEHLPESTIIYFQSNLKESIQEKFGNAYEYYGHSIRYIGES